MTAPRILIADDEPPIRAIIERRLQSSGIDVLVGTNGLEALEIATEERPDMVISDLQMPVMTGIEFAIALREHPEIPEIPFILLTARGHIVEDEQMERARITRIMSKPFSAREVVETALADLAMYRGERGAA